MRVTNKMLTDSVINTVNTNLHRLDKYQQQLSSGKRINKPSDDPISTAQLLAAKSALKSQEQYRRNMEDGVGWMNTSDGALSQVNNVLQRLRELAVSGSNGTMSEGSMQALADEVDNLGEEMVQLANTNYAGRFIFGGGKTTQPPFEITAKENDKIAEVQFVDPAFNIGLLDETYKLEIEIESGVRIDISSGKNAFHTDPNGILQLNSVFNKIIDLRKSLEDGDQTTANSLIGDFDKLIDNVLSERAVVGAKIKRLESAQDRSSAYELDLNELLGKLEDVDYAEATMGFKVQQTVYEAALETGAQLIQPTLIDFLK